MARDYLAAEQLRRQRVDAGMSPERLGWVAGISGHTIRRIEQQGVIPTARVQFALAAHFGLKPTDLWTRQRARSAA